MFLKETRDSLLFHLFLSHAVSLMTKLKFPAKIVVFVVVVVRVGRIVVHSALYLHHQTMLARQFNEWITPRHTTFGLSKCGIFPPPALRWFHRQGIL